MLIGGLQKLTLIDYPGKLAATVFCLGCNFRCPFCFTENNYLLTDQGRLKIKDIVENKINCKIYDLKGNFSSINKYFQRETKKILQIKTFLNSEIIECTPNHKFLIYDSLVKKIVEKEAQKLNKKYNFLTISIPQKEIFNYKLDVNPAITTLYQALNTRPRLNNEKLFKKVVQLRDKGYSWRKIYKIFKITDHVRRVITNGDYLDSKILPIIKTKEEKIAVKGGEFYVDKFVDLTPEFLRLIGYYLAEGCVSKESDRRNSYYVSFTFNSKEKEFINDVKKIFFDVFKTELIEVKSKRYKTVELYCYKGIIGLFFKYYFGSNSYNKKLPSDFIILDKRLQEELIKGLFWGDGITSEKSIRKYQQQRIALTSGNLQYQISLILYRLGVKHSRFRREIIIKDKKIFDILGQSYLIRKKIINTESRYGFLDDKYVYLKIDYIKERKKAAKVYNLEINNLSHTYNISLVNVSNCYNSELVLPEKIKEQRAIDEKDFFDFLEERKELLEGVCITGGEPTTYDDLPFFIKKIRKLGYLVKLDTNGSNPRMLKKLIDEKLIDYAAMDIKAPLGLKSQFSNPNFQLNSKSQIPKYEEATGIKINLSKIKESVEILKNSDIGFEFRTTVVPGIHTKEDIVEISKWIGGPKVKYYLQNFRPEKTIDPKFKKIKPYPQEYLLEIKKAISPFFEICQVR